MPVPHIFLKGVITNLSLGPDGETIASVSTPSAGGQPMPVDEPYKFEPYFSIIVRAADLGNPPLGATVEVEVRLS